MKISPKVVLPLVILALGAIGLILLSTMKQPLEQKITADKTPVVEVFVVDVQPYQLMIKSQGVSEPLSQTQLIANVSGIVLSYNSAFNAGGMVTQGEVLVEIEKLDYLSALKTSEANLARARAGYAEEKARSKIAADEWAREGRSKSAPLLGLRKPQLAREKANVLSAQASLEGAKRNLERTTIVAPYNAIVSQRNIDIGQLVTVNNSLGEIMATDIAEIRLPISLDDYYRLNLNGTSAGDETQVNPNTEVDKVTLSARMGQQTLTWPGIIVRDEGVINTNNRLLYLVARVVDPYGLNTRSTSLSNNQAEIGSRHKSSLRFGSFLQAQIQGPIIEDVSKIPKASLVRDEYVFVVGSDSKLSKKPVSIVGENDQYVYVSSSLKSGDQVLNTRLLQALPGLRVKINPTLDSANVQ
jgi:multidrug efflux pump subunit AcrA (membrane-fusion protein)